MWKILLNVSISSLLAKLLIQDKLKREWKEKILEGSYVNGTKEDSSFDWFRFPRFTMQKQQSYHFLLGLWPGRAVKNRHQICKHTLSRLLQPHASRAPRHTCVSLVESQAFTLTTIKFVFGSGVTTYQSSHTNNFLEKNSL